MAGTKATLVGSFFLALGCCGVPAESSASSQLKPKPDGPKARQSTPVQKVDARSLLVRTLQKYARMKSFSARCTYYLNDGKNVTGGWRTIHYRAPNLFRIESHGYNGWLMSSISDGTMVFECITKDPRPSRLGSVETIASPRFGRITGKQLLGSTTFSGYVMYQFFSGGGLSHLVDPKRNSVRQEGWSMVEGDKCRVISFTTVVYGKSLVYISENSMLVRKVVTDLSPMSHVLDAADRRHDTHAKKRHWLLQETYTNIQVNRPMPDELFRPD